MAVNNTEIAATFAAMIAAVQAPLDTAYNADKMDAEIYSKVLATMMQPTLQLATQAVQQQPVLDAQVLKTQKDTLFVEKQTIELGASVTYNNKIKALTTYAETIGALGQGGLVPSSDMWTTLFLMIQDLNSAGTLPTSTTITKAV
ncbi:MAG: hypothetical protein WBK67_02415 [Minisyncoccales bacterium]